jgi:excisionase family DNA binding protein
VPNLTTNEAAAVLQVTRRRVLELIKLGTLRAEKFGRDWQIDPLSLEAYKNSPRKAGRKPWKKPTNVATNVESNNNAAKHPKRDSTEKDKLHDV